MSLLELVSAPNYTFNLALIGDKDSNKDQYKTILNKHIKNIDKLDKIT